MESELEWTLDKKRPSRYRFCYVVRHARIHLLNLASFLQLTSIRRKLSLPVKLSCVLKLWWLELLCCLGMLAAMGEIFFILARYQGQPSTNWPTIVSINTILAIFTLTIKSSMALVVQECRFSSMSLGLLLDTNKHSSHQSDEMALVPTDSSA